MFCLLTCDSYQSTVAGGSAHVDPKSKRKVVTSVDYYVSRDYAFGMYNSCQDVYFNDTVTVFDLFCQKINCTLEEVLNAIGSSETAFIPLSVNFKVTGAKYIVDGNKTFVPINPDTTPCKDRCSCKNCRSSCV